MTSARAGTATTRRAAPRRQPPDWSFGDRLRKIRTDVAEMRQEQFANELSVTKPALAAWETGRTHPRDMVAFAKRVELLTGVPAAWILGVDYARPIDPDGPGGHAVTGSGTGEYLPASRGGDDAFAQVLDLPLRNRPVASSNTTSSPSAEHASADFTRSSDARTGNRASAA